MNLNSIKSWGVCEIKLPDGSESDIKIEVYGSRSKQYKKAVRDLSEESPEGKLTLNESFEHGLSLLIACTKSWEGIEEKDEPVEFSEEEAKRIYTDHPWITEQVDKYIAENAHFF
jgi:hypothetical protein